MTEESVYCAVRDESLYMTEINLSLQRSNESIWLRSRIKLNFGRAKQLIIGAQLAQVFDLTRSATHSLPAITQLHSRFQFVLTCTARELSTDVTGAEFLTPNFRNRLLT